MALPEGFLDLLSKLSRVCARYEELTERPAVIVGGAAAAIYTAGDISTGDIDVIAGNDTAFAAALQEEGFVTERRQGKLLGGYYHPDLPAYGVEQVSGPLFDGRADPQRNLKITVRGHGTFVLPSAEDMIADRLAQHSVCAGSDEMLRQARMIYRLADEIDEAYLRKRVLEEGGDVALLDSAGRSAKRTVMTKQIELADLLSRVSARRDMLGLDAPEVDEMMRNSGARRTAEKRTALRQIEARARSAGVDPVPGKF